MNMYNVVTSDIHKRDQVSLIRRTTTGGGVSGCLWEMNYNATHLKDGMQMNPMCRKNNTLLAGNSS